MRIQRLELQQVRIRIDDIVGRDSLEVGEIETYRALISRGGSRIEYRWDFGDGTFSDGNPAAHRYYRPGMFTITVTARNRAGSATLSKTVEVFLDLERPAPPPPPPVVTTPDRMTPTRADSVVLQPTTTPRGTRAEQSAEATEPEDTARQADRPPRTRPTRPTAAPPRESFLWSVATYFEVRKAERFAEALRDGGFSAEVFVDNVGIGSTVFRVAIGRYPTREAAMAARDAIPPALAPNPLLYRLPLR